MKSEKQRQSGLAHTRLRAWARRKNPSRDARLLAAALPLALFITIGGSTSFSGAAESPATTLVAISAEAQSCTISESGVANILRDPAGGWRDVVVIAPHIDDESLFLGETLAALDERGVDVTLLFTTSSQGGRGMDPRYGQDRNDAYGRVASTLGIDHTYLSEIADGTPMDSFETKCDLTEEWIESLGVARPGVVLFTIGGGGHYDHRVAEQVGRRIARANGLPLFVYLGYGPEHKDQLASDENWGPAMRPANVVGTPRFGQLERKRLAIGTYRAMYYQRGWQRYWVSIATLEMRARDVVGYVPTP